MPRVRIRVPVCLLAAGALLLPAATAQAEVSACASAASPPQPGAIGQARRTTLCLINRERAAHGLRPLKMYRRLSLAARRHSREMVERDFFAHGNFAARIVNAGYVTRRQRWTLAENLAFGTGSKASPQETMKSWMASPGHRANILNGAFRHVGVGIVLGAPGQGDAGATYTTDFGTKG